VQPGGRHRYPAQHLVDRPRSEPRRTGASAIRFEGIYQRLQAAPPSQELPEAYVDPALGLREHREALERARLLWGRTAPDRLPRRALIFPEDFRVARTSPPARNRTPRWQDQGRRPDADAVSRHARDQIARAVPPVGAVQVGADLPVRRAR